MAGVASLGVEWSVRARRGEVRQVGRGAVRLGKVR